MFFDYTKSAHRSLIKPAHQQLIEKNKDLIEHIEQEVLFEFTTRQTNLLDTRTVPVEQRDYYCDGSYKAVMLRGFDPDPEVCEPMLAFALVSTIAQVVNHRLFQQNVNSVQQGISSSGGAGSASVNYREDANARFPDGWSTWLVRFDTRSLNSATSPIILAWG